jgi:hypothetical protein
MVAPNVSCLRALAVTLVTAGLAACGPGAATPMPEPPSIDVSRVASAEDAVAQLGGPMPIQLIGDVGAATPSSTVRVLNLDDLREAVATTADAEGRFALAVIANAGDELRFEASTKDGFSAPVDARVMDDLSGIAISRRPDCLALESGYALELTPGKTGSVRLMNECDGEVSVDDVRLRRGDAGFSIASATPFALSPGASTSVDVQLTPGSTPTQDVLFLELTVEGQAARYSVSLRAASE